jgi:DNA primase (bacterial type)
MDTATIIKSKISMRQVADRYGLPPNRSGYINCPFHAENTPSLKIYDEPGRGFSCFGCGKSGSVIDFVMGIYQISFRQAVLRLATDFGIPISGKPAAREINHIRAAETEKQIKLRALARHEMDLIVEHERLWSQFMAGPEWSDGWCEALDRIDLINYRLEEIWTTQKMIS